MRQICEAAGCGNINLLQHAYYNGHYKYHGAKVQHVLQADGMVYAYMCPIRNHDALVLCNSMMHEMLWALYINWDPNQPVHFVTDKTYGRNNHFRPNHTAAGFKQLVPADCVGQSEFDRRHQKAHLAVEDSFNQQVVKLRYSDHSKSHKITVNSHSN